MTVLTAKQQEALVAFLEAARELGLSRKAQAELLGLPLRTYQRRLKEGRLSPAEAAAAQFLPEALREAEAALGDGARARAWLTAYVPALGARPVELLRDLEGYKRVRAALGAAVYGFY